jgi:hypothetical protein
MFFRSFTVLISFLLISNSYPGDNFKIPNVPDGSVKKFAGNDMTPYENTSQFQQKYQNEQERRAQLEVELHDLKTKLVKEDKTKSDKNDNEKESNLTTQGTSKPNSFQKLYSSSDMVKDKNNIRKKSKIKNSGKGVYKAPMIFTVSESSLNSYNTTVLPLGSYVKTRILTGVEANDKEPYPMLLQADYAFVGPNGSKVDMSGCFFIAKAKGNLSTERVLGEITELSCVRSNGEHFKRTVRGYIAGEDSTFGVTGELISKQGQVLSAAIVANLAKGAGEAIALGQQQQTIVVGSAGAAATATNVTGNTAAFVGGRAVADAATIIAQWYLNYATSLVPSIAVGSGRDIWVIMLDDTDVPSLDDSQS